MSTIYDWHDSNMTFRIADTSTLFFAALIGAVIFLSYQIGIETSDTAEKYLTIQTGYCCSLMHFRRCDSVIRTGKSEFIVYVFGLWEYRKECSYDNHFEGYPSFIWWAQKVIVFILCGLIGFLLTKTVCKRIPAGRTP